MHRRTGPATGWARRAAALAAAFACACAALAHASAGEAAPERAQLLALTHAYADAARGLASLIESVAPLRIALDFDERNAQGLAILHDTSDAALFWERAEAIAAQAQWGQAQAEAISARAALYLQSGKLAAARDDALRALELARQDVDSAAELRAELIVANSLRLLGEVNRAQQHASAAEKLARQLGDARARSQALTLLAVLTKNQGNYLQGLRYEIEALNEEVPGSDIETRALTLSKLGKLYEQIEDNDAALDYQNQALTLAEGQAADGTLAHILVSYANVLNDLAPNEHERALAFATRALASARRIADRTLEIDAELQLARAQFNAALVAPAAAGFAHALASAREIGQRVSVAHVLLRQGELFERSGHLREAIDNSREAIGIYRQSGNLPRLIKSFAILERQLDASGDHAAAATVRLDRFELRDRVLGASAMRALAELEARTPRESSEQQIQLLQRQGEIDTLRLDRQSLQRWIMLLLVGASCATLLLVVWRFQSILRVNRLLKSKNQEILHQQYALEANNAELRSSAERLFATATTDALTGTFSRSHGLTILAAEIEAAHASAEALSVMLIDVDNFKQVNDRFGHLHGDRALATVARLLRAKLRPTETIVRFGGDEFLVFLPRTGLDAAIAIGESMRSDIERHPQKADPHLQLTVSFGICATPLLAEVTVESMLASADSALYAAKHAGRNRVRSFVADAGSAPATPRGASAP
ncbi:MAG: tetratricopeptide repeat-containing diguanylate cyclase [Rudaea sp.]